MNTRYTVESGSATVEPAVDSRSAAISRARQRASMTGGRFHVVKWRDDRRHAVVWRSWVEGRGRWANPTR